MLEHRLLKLAVFILYWLGFVPWLVLVLQRLHLLNATNYTDLFLQYTTVFFVLLLIYIVVHQVFEYFYLRRKIKKVVRRVTIRRQLERFERGEIDLVAAQRISTFTKLKPPKRLQKKKRKSLTVKRKEQPAIMPEEKQITLEKKKNNEGNEKIFPRKELEKQDNEEVKEVKESPSCLEVVVMEKHDS